MIGILMAGGAGSRMFPLTNVVNKHLLNIYDKPMIYYSLSLFLLLKIRKIYLICNENDKKLNIKLFSIYKNFGFEIFYIIQKKPRGIAEGLMLCKKYIKTNKVFLVLGDNILHGSGLIKVLENAISSLNDDNAIIFPVKANNPNRYGVPLFQNKKIIKIYEKPKRYISNYAIPGIYLYGTNVLNHLKTLKPSKRNELEITDLNNIYIKHSLLKHKLLPQGINWLDTGSPNSLNDASNYVRTIQTNQGNIIACIEEICCENNWISKKDLKKFFLYKNLNNQYIKYVSSIR